MYGRAEEVHAITNRTSQPMISHVASHTLFTPLTRNTPCPPMRCRCRAQVRLRAPASGDTPRRLGSGGGRSLPRGQRDVGEAVDEPRTNGEDSFSGNIPYHATQARSTYSIKVATWCSRRIRTGKGLVCRPIANRDRFFTSPLLNHDRFFIFPLG